MFRRCKETIFCSVYLILFCVWKNLNKVIANKKCSTTFSMASDLSLRCIWLSLNACSTAPPVQPPKMLKQPQTVFEWDTDKLPHNCHHTNHSCYTALTFDGWDRQSSKEGHHFVEVTRMQKIFDRNAVNLGKVQESLAWFTKVQYNWEQWDAV